MPVMGVLSGGAVPHADTQNNRIPDFQKALLTKEIEPVLALGEDVMAEYENGKFQRAVSPLDTAVAGWVTREKFITIKVEKI